MADPNMSANLSLAEDIAFDDVRPVDDMPDFNNTILPEMDIVPFEESIEFPQIAAPIDDIPPMDLPEDLPPMDIEELPMVRAHPTCLTYFFTFPTPNCCVVLFYQ